MGTPQRTGTADLSHLPLPPGSSGFPLMGETQRFIVYGTDSFRTGGDDHGVGPLLFDLAEAAFVLWSVGLLVYGISVVERWRALRAGVAVALPILAILVFTVALAIPLSSR